MQIFLISKRPLAVTTRRLSWHSTSPSSISGVSRASVCGSVAAMFTTPRSLANELADGSTSLIRAWSTASSFAKDLGVVNIAATLPQTLAPAVAGFVILVFGGYGALFPIGVVLSILGAFAVWFIKAVR